MVKIRSSNFAYNNRIRRGVSGANKEARQTLHRYKCGSSETYNKGANSARLIAIIIGGTSKGAVAGARSSTGPSAKNMSAAITPALKSISFSSPSQSNTLLCASVSYPCPYYTRPFSLMIGR